MEYNYIEMNAVPRKGGTSVADLQCEYIAGTVRCPYDAAHKCTGNWCHGGVYCVKHIQYLNFQYICDSCIRETERTRREIAEEEEKKRTREAEAVAIIRSIYIAQEKAKIRRPRIIILLSVILLVPGFIIAQANIHPYDTTPLINANPPLAYTLIGMLILGGMLLIVGWIWVIILALLRRQKEWAILFGNY